MAFPSLKAKHRTGESIGSRNGKPPFTNKISVSGNGGQRVQNFPLSSGQHHCHKHKTAHQHRFLLPAVPNVQKTIPAENSRSQHEVGQRLAAAAGQPCSYRICFSTVTATSSGRSNRSFINRQQRVIIFVSTGPKSNDGFFKDKEKIPPFKIKVKAVEQRNRLHHRNKTVIPIGQRSFNLQEQIDFRSGMIGYHIRTLPFPSVFQPFSSFSSLRSSGIVKEMRKYPSPEGP